MAVPPHNKYAPVNVAAPEPVGICMRCARVFPLSRLVWQYQWAGPILQNLHILVCTLSCDDLPQEQLRTILIGPDPVPPKHPSPWFYAQQNVGGVAGPGDFPPLPDDTPP